MADHRFASRGPDVSRNDLPPKLFGQDAEAGTWLASIEASVVYGLGSQLSELTTSSDPCWGAIYSLLTRIHEHASGVVALFYGSHWEPLEVVARSVIEASVSLILLSRGDRVIRLSQFLTHHLSTMKRRVLASDESLLDMALHRFERRVDYVNQAFAGSGIEFDTIGWPKTTKDRFAAAGMANEYSHIYAALSSSVHGDAEYLIDDLINHIIISQKPAAAEASRLEKLYWARYYTYNSILYYAYAARSYGEAYELDSLLAELDGLIPAVHNKLATHSQEFRKSTEKIKSRMSRGQGFGDYNGTK